MADILAELLAPILAILFYGIGYASGYFVVILFSLAMLEPAPFDQTTDDDFRRSVGMRWWHVTYTIDQQRYLAAEAVVLVGYIPFALIAGLVYLISVTY